jgi:hypothetical protein
MATQAEVINYIKTNYKCEAVSGDLFKVLVEYESNRSQLVFVAVHEHAIVFNSPFASENDLTAAQALNAVTDELFGIKNIAGLYSLANLIFMEDLDESEINKGIFFIAKSADDLEKSLVGGDRL